MPAPAIAINRLLGGNAACSPPSALTTTFPNPASAITRMKRIATAAAHVPPGRDIQLGGLRKRLQERDLDIELTDQARDLLGEAGFDPVYGARPLKRAIQQQIENPLAERNLKGEFQPGDRIRIGVRDGQLTFGKVDERRAARA